MAGSPVFALGFFGRQGRQFEGDPPDPLRDHPLAANLIACTPASPSFRIAASSDGNCRRTNPRLRAMPSLLLDRLWTFISSCKENYIPKRALFTPDDPRQLDRKNTRLKSSPH